MSEAQTRHRNGGGVPPSAGGRAGVRRSPPAALAAFGWTARLSRREADVLRLLADGQSTVEIGHTLFISPATVKCHVARLIAKVGVRDRVQLVVAAYRSGFVRVD